MVRMAVRAFRARLRLLKRNREKKEKRERERLQRGKEKRGVIVQGESGGGGVLRGGEESLCNIASGNVAHYLVAALTICTMDHPRQCLSFESGGTERDA